VCFCSAQVKEGSLRMHCSFTNMASESPTRHHICSNSVPALMLNVVSSCPCSTGLLQPQGAFPESQGTHVSLTFCGRVSCACFHRASMTAKSCGGSRWRIRPWWPPVPLLGEAARR
jgi:hypothetical protein